MPACDIAGDADRLERRTELEDPGPQLRPGELLDRPGRVSGARQNQATLAVLALLISFYLWYLHGRLICLGPDDDNCAIIGTVRSHSQSDPGEKYGDDDYTMNLWLAPGPITDDEEEKDYWEEPRAISSPKRKRSWTSTRPRCSESGSSTCRDYLTRGVLDVL
jgi:hypothetical protein